VCAYGIVEVNVSAHSSLVELHHWSIVVSHRHLRVAGVSLHNFTHCFQLYTQTTSDLTTTDAVLRYEFPHSITLCIHEYSASFLNFLFLVCLS